jgi:hypothetical protein
MKALLVFLMVFASAQTFSAEMPDVNSSWETISSDSRVIYQLPQYKLSHGSYMRALSVCVDGEFLRSIKKVTRCTEYRGRNDRCVFWQTVRPYFQQLVKTVQLKQETLSSAGLEDLSIFT